MEAAETILQGNPEYTPHSETTFPSSRSYTFILARCSDIPVPPLDLINSSTYSLSLHTPLIVYVVHQEKETNPAPPAFQTGEHSTNKMKPFK